jgi:hypothetical protein
VDHFLARNGQVRDDTKQLRHIAFHHPISLACQQCVAYEKVKVLIFLDQVAAPEGK